MSNLDLDAKWTNNHLSNKIPYTSSYRTGIFDNIIELFLKIYLVFFCHTVDFIHLGNACLRFLIYLDGIKVRKKEQPKVYIWLLLSIRYERINVYNLILLLFSVDHVLYTGKPTLSLSVIFLNIRQGFPAATTPDGISWVTTLPAPITVSSPIVTPLSMVLPPPIQTLFPMLTGSGIKAPAIRSAESSEWLAEYILTLGPNSVLFPIVICPQSRIVHPKLI